MLMHRTFSRVHRYAYLVDGADSIERTTNRLSWPATISNGLSPQWCHRAAPATSCGVTPRPVHHAHAHHHVETPQHRPRSRRSDYLHSLRRQLPRPTSAASLPTMSRRFSATSAFSRGCLPSNVFAGHRQLQILDHPRPGDAERLAGLVVRPHAAVLAQRRADDGQRLVLQRAVAERPRQPVDGVLQHAGNAAVVLGGDDQGGVGIGGRLHAAPPPARPRRRCRCPRCRTAAPPAGRTAAASRRPVRSRPPARPADD